jgi:hypothetical protein
MKRSFVVYVSCAAVALLGVTLASSRAADTKPAAQVEKQAARKADPKADPKAEKSKADKPKADKKKAGKKKAGQKPGKAAVERARKTAQMLDEIYKRTIVLITDKYVDSPDDFAAGSAAVLLFEQITDGGSHAVRLIDATGSPYDPENVAQDDFEKEAIQRLKAGAATHEQVTTSEKGQPVLRVVTAVPVVLERCIMCHDHYADAKRGEPIGAISYTIPIE